MLIFYHGLVLLSLLSITTYAHSSTRTTTNVARQNSNVANSQFVSAQGSGLMVNGSRFTYIGTTAYWLSSLNSDEDIDHTLGNISQAGFNAVRTWAFNGVSSLRLPRFKPLPRFMETLTIDVEQIPENGTWFQLIQNGTVTINNGTNGLQRLDKVLELAQKHGLYVLLSLTNNWNPHPSDVINITDPLTVFQFGKRDTILGFNGTRPRNTLSNDYGGMDAYVRNFGGLREHDQFFTNQTLINAFKNYTTQIVQRYRDHPNVLSWELANDPRCNSSVSNSPGCVTQNITLWHSDLAQHVKSIDPNHLVSSGTQGFQCTQCQKLFPPHPPRQAAPQPSPAPGIRRNTATFFTKERILRERKEAFKRTRAATKKSTSQGGIRIRGRWVSTPTRRQESSDSAQDGSFGVDSNDILGIPEIGLSSFQLFPDQNKYAPDDPNLPPFNNSLNQGLDWIRDHATAGQVFGKPVTMNAVGLVTQQNAQDFVPFNTTIAPFADDTTSATQQSFATDAQASDALSQWMNAAVEGGIQGIIQYGWTQSGLTTAPGSIIDSPTSLVPDQTPTEPVQTQTGTSPNDGYGTNDIGSLASIVQSVGQNFLPDNNARR